MIALHINIDHVATVRQARQISEPDPVTAAGLVELAGADGITIHLREDRRHIIDRDVRILRKTVQTRLNLEMAATEEMVDIALELKPYQVSLVPEKRQEVTTEGGLDVCSQVPDLIDIRKRIKNEGILFSLFVDPDINQLEACKEVKADSIEINTGNYSELLTPKDLEIELSRIQKASKYASDMGLRVFAGHGLNYDNVKAIAAIPEVEELNIGHFLVAQSVYVGMENAVKRMIQIIEMTQS